MKFDQPIASVQVFKGDEPAGADELTAENVKGVVSFLDNPENVMAKVAISSVGCPNAGLNMQTELPHWDFARA